MTRIPVGYASSFIQPGTGIAVSKSSMVTLLDSVDANFIDIYTILGSGTTLSAALAAIAPLTPAADQLPYFINATGAALTTLTSYGRTLIASSTAGDARTNLGGTAVGTGVFTAVSSSAGQVALGAGAVGQSIFNSVTASAAQTAMGAGPMGQSLFAASTATVAQTAMGVVPTTYALTVSATGPIRLNGTTASSPFSGTSTGVSFVASTVVPGTYGSSTSVGQFTVDQFGIVTSASSVPITASGVGFVPTSYAVTTSSTGPLRINSTTGSFAFTGASMPMAFATSPVGATTFGSSTAVAQITTDQFGIVQSGSSITITPTNIGAVPTARTIQVTGPLSINGTVGGTIALSSNITLDHTRPVAATTIGSSTAWPIITFDTAGHATVLSSQAASAPALVYITSATASASASITLSTGSTYNNFLLIIDEIQPATNAVNLLLQYNSIVANYEWFCDASNSGVFSASNSGSDSGIALATSLSNGNNNRASFMVWIMNRVPTNANGIITNWVGGRSPNTMYRGSGDNSSSATLTGVTLLMSSGNITQGVARLYGYVNS